jgi:GTP-binding protein HflX
MHGEVPMTKARRDLLDTSAHSDRTMIIGVYTPKVRQTQDHYFEEFEKLVKTAGISPVHRMHVKIRSYEIATFFSKGKLQEIIDTVKEHKITDIVVSVQLSPLQERNLQEMIGCTVFDRTQLILEIFDHTAQSAEGKIQVEMAFLQHLKTRLAGRGKEMAQQEGFVGACGPGESIKEHLRRYYEGKLVQARKRLETLSKSRETQRKQRLRVGIPLICLVGYTNAGKSSLLNTLTKSTVLAEDKLFATLDTTVRELYLAPHKKALISDTVGFISDLSHHLIEAFKSTLDELKYAQMLVHVVDISNPAWPEQAATVQDTLKDLEIKSPLVYAINKIDLLSPEELAAVQERLHNLQPYVMISAHNKESAQKLLSYIAARI